MQRGGADPSAQSDEGTSKLNHRISTCGRTFRVGTSLLRRLPHLSVPVRCVWRLGGLVFCDTHSHVRRPRDRGVVARFRAGTLFHEVNVTSLTCTVDASASSDAATGLEVDGKAAPAIHTVHSTAPAYQEIRVLVSARDATTTTNVVHAFFQPVPCDCYAGTCNAFDGSCVCDAEWYGSSCNAHCPGSALPRQGDV